MKKCAKCKIRESCTRLCYGVEKYLPCEYTGKNPLREINMDPSGLEAVSGARSFEGWSRFESTGRRCEVDLSVITPNEKTALLFIASGMPQSEAAKRLKISRSSLRSRINKARAKLLATQNLYLIEGQNDGIGRDGEGCANG